MEERKPDFNSIIGFVLIGLIMVWMLYSNQAKLAESQTEEPRQEQTETNEKPVETAETEPLAAQQPVNDSLQNAALHEKLGAFSYSAGFSDGESSTTLENEVLLLKIDRKGGAISEAHIKKYVTHDSLPVFIVKDGNAAFNMTLKTSDNRILNTSGLFFEPQLLQEGENQVLSMKLKASENNYLEYRYTLKPNDYLLDFEVNSKGLENVLNRSEDVLLEWQLKGFRNAKSVEYENRYTRLNYAYEDGKTSKLSPTGDDDETAKDVDWISYRQHFFSAYLGSKKPFDEVKFFSKNLVEEESKEVVFTKDYRSEIPLKLEGGELNYPMYMYYGPTDLNTLSAYEGLSLEDSIPFGWGLFGWINKQVFTPLYTWLSSFLSYGMAIIIMTLLVRLVLSPVTYKSYLSQAKMKVLRPEITTINEKYKDDAMQKQKETMKLYNKAGVNPMSGCIPALLQLPVFYALFMFFPTAFALRQKSFLWAEDLSAYDTIAKLPFSIPFYGDHVSLFPILASIALLVYMMLTTGQTMQTQPGMPNMKFIMYLSPLFMLIFFNNYASGLSLYYFISNLITIFLVLAIKNFILDEEKIHAKIEAKKKQPKKENRFQRKMREVMEKAEEQKKLQQKSKRRN